MLLKIKYLIKALVINPDLMLSFLIFLPMLMITEEVFFLMTVYTLLTLILGPLTHLSVQYLESQYPIIDPSGKNNPVLILGGGHTPKEYLPENQQLTLGALGRVMEGIRIFKGSNSKKLIMSGPSLKADYTSQAGIQAIVATELCAISPNSIYINSKPNTTEEEALTYQQVFPSINPILVTKAIHMPRAILSFKKHGIEAVPAPCNFIFKDRHLEIKHYLVPKLSHIPYLGEVLKEFFGILFLKLTMITKKKPSLVKTYNHG